MFKNTIDNKRYYTLNCFFKNKFNTKVSKIPLDAGFSCPNKINGGCIYCKDSSASNIINKQDTIKEQFENGKQVLQKKWPNSKFIAYFQAGSNTYANLNILKSTFNQVLNYKDLVGISIATRPDCITNECLEYLSELNKKTFLTIELGLQSSNDKTLKLINRGHTKKDFTNCVKRLKQKNIFVVAHIINGLPNENEKDMLDTVKYLNKLNIDGIKIHMLYISKGTKIERLNFHILTKEEYIGIVCNQLEYLNENIIIERITGDPIKEDLISPTWLLKKFCILNDIDKEMKRRNIYQGDKVIKT